MRGEDVNCRRTAIIRDTLDTFSDTAVKLKEALGHRDGTAAAARASPAWSPRPAATAATASRPSCSSSPRASATS